MRVLAIVVITVAWSVSYLSFLLFVTVLLLMSKWSLIHAVAPIQYLLFCRPPAVEVRSGIGSKVPGGQMEPDHGSRTALDVVYFLKTL